MKRVLCLYRVSTKQQVNAEDDIPVQRRECQAFIAQHPDWILIYEKLEKGVSGYKLSINQRDVIMEIKQLAEQEKFDILLVFMFDRLGRREDETPFLVEWFIAHHIEVWSTREGQTRLENRGDKLINYIRYWQAGGESEKTSLRVSAAHAQMTMDGIWRGGTKPFGYHLVHKGRKNKRGHELWDIEVDEKESLIVREIFTLFCEQGYGTYAIANLMNDRHPSIAKIWTPQTVRTIIKNPIYTGRFHMNQVLSESNEQLRIITDEEYDFAQSAMQRHIQKRYPLARLSERAQLPFEDSTKASVFGATILSGILHCGHCGARLVGGYCTKHTKDMVIHRPVYRCYNRGIKAKKCTGQTVYSASKIEPVVINALKQYFISIKQSVDIGWREEARAEFEARLASKLREMDAQYESLLKTEESIKSEIVKSLRGESQFNRDVLSELMGQNRLAQERVLAEINQCRGEQQLADAQIRYLSEQYKYVIDWADGFDYAPRDLKKMIIARFIERITVDREYNITIYFYMSSEAFQTRVEQDSDGLHVRMTNHPMRQIIEAEKRKNTKK